MRNEAKTVYGTATVFYSFGTDLTEF
jgi:hypothetical protein